VERLDFRPHLISARQGGVFTAAFPPFPSASGAAYLWKRVRKQTPAL
jgi:hypothetical protein